MNWCLGPRLAWTGMQHRCQNYRELPDNSHGQIGLRTIIPECYCTRLWNSCAHPSGCCSNIWFSAHLFSGCPTGWTHHLSILGHMTLLLLHWLWKKPEFHPHSFFFWSPIAFDKINRLHFKTSFRCTEKLSKSTERVFILPPTRLVSTIINILR